MINFKDYTDKAKQPILVAVILILAAIVFSPIFKNAFTNWDDIYIANNPFLKNLSLANLKLYFTSYYSGNYHPLTLISLALDYKLGGIHPWIYQLTNLILHIINTLMVFVLIKLLIKQLPASSKYSVIPVVVALLFAIHPLQVESVVWISERKNVLYAFFFLASLILYIKYVYKNSSAFYILSIVMFLLSLLSKGMAVPLSVCIIAIDYWFGRNLLSKRIIFEKIPYLLLSLIFGLVAIYAQRSVDAIRSEEHFSYFDRLATASYGFVLYLVKLCVPGHLSVFYPYPEKSGAWLPFQFYACIAVILILLSVIWIYFRKNKVIVFSSLFFTANISIVLQFLPVGDAIVSDRYVYIASIGLFAIIGYCCNKLWYKKTIYRNSIIAFLVVYSLALSVQTYNRVGVWKDSFTLWSNAVEHYPQNNDRGFQNLGIYYFEKGNYAEAEKNYNRVLQMKLPNKTAYSKAYVGKGQIKQLQNDWQGAMKDYNSALSFCPTYEAYFNRGVLKMKTGDNDGALADYDNATQIEPFRTEAYINRGLLLSQTGNLNLALQNFNEALSLNPENYNAYFLRGQVKQSMNDFQGAMNDFNISLSISRTYEGFLSRAVLRMAIKDFEGALGDLNMASLIDPMKSEIYINRGVIELNYGNTAEALNEFSKATEVNPNDYRTFLYLGYGKFTISDFVGAIPEFSKSIQIQPNADAYYYRGLAKIKLGDKVGVCADLTQAAMMGNSQAQVELQKSCK
jgi:tetratricopeptide (TPR) repeat protein